MNAPTIPPPEPGGKPRSIMFAETLQPTDRPATSKKARPSPKADKPAWTLAQCLKRDIEHRDEVLEGDKDYRPLRYPLRTMREIRPPLDNRYWIKGWIPQNALVVIYGPPKSAKSFTVQDMAGHVAIGKDYRGCRVKAGAVVYICAEGAVGFDARVSAWRDEHVAEDGDAPFYVLSTRFDLVREHLAFIDDIGWQLANTGNPAIIVIDTLNRTFVGSESSDEDMTAYVNAADALKVAGDIGAGTSVIIVHHSGLEAGRPRGHTSLAGAADVQISISKDKATKVITATVELGKDVEEGLQATSKLRVVEIGTDEDGDPVTTCLVEATDEVVPKKTDKFRLAPSRKIALTALRQAIGEHGAIPPASNHIPANTRTVSAELWRLTAYARNISDGTQHAKNAAFNRSSEQLQEFGLIGVWQDQVWPIEARP